MKSLGKVALATSLATALMTASATAGSMAEPIATPVVFAPAPLADWAGSYVGGFVGYGDGRYELGTFEDAARGPKVGVDGGLAGLRYGYNWQQNSRVFGFDISLSSGIDGIAPQGTVGPAYFCGTGDCNVSIDTLLMARGRYGALISPATLVYGAAGLAAGRVKGGIYNSTFQGSSTAVGYTVGVGIEHKLNQKFSMFGEVNYVDLGKLDFGETAAPAKGFGAKGDFTTVMIGVNYRF